MILQYRAAQQASGDQDAARGSFLCNKSNAVLYTDTDQGRAGFVLLYGLDSVQFTVYDCLCMTKRV